MKILLANKLYYRRGGDCIYLLNLEQLLKKHGHEIAIFAMRHAENLQTPCTKYFPSEVEFSPGLKGIKALLRPFGMREIKTKFNLLLDDFKPDVVHLNNIHSQLSPVIAEIARHRGIKVVWTLHDYKLLCPRYDCLRNGEMICEKCFIDKRNVLKYRCMKNSLPASVIAFFEAVKWSRKKLAQYTDTFICPSEFMASKMRQGGFDKNKIVTLCNFIDSEKTKRTDYNKSDYYCYVGRLSPEKGIETLLKAANRLPYKLKVIGNGDASGAACNISADNIEFLGYKNWDEIKEIVGKARFVILPSLWYENNPLSVIEAQCLGTPVLGADIGGIPELINTSNGMLFESKNVEDLKDKASKMFESDFDYEKIARDARQRYAAERYYDELIRIYSL